MAQSFTAFPAVPVVTQQDFARSDLIHEIFGAAIARQATHPAAPAECQAEAVPAEGGLTLAFTSRFDGLTGPLAVTHKFFFVDRDETRERMHLVDPADPRARTELRILLPEGVDRDYCHASVFDAGNRLLATYALVFDRGGRIVQYPFTDRFVSPLELDRAALAEVRDALGRRVIRFSIALKNLTGPERVNIAWEAIGISHRRELTCSPDTPEVADELLLEDNPALAPGDWVAIAVDEKDRVLAQCLVTILPAAPADPAWTR